MKKELLLEIVKFLLKEGNYNIELLNSYVELKRLYKALVSIRMPYPISEDILKLEDEYLNLELKDKKIIDVSTLKEIDDNIILWQGDITTLKCYAIV